MHPDREAVLAGGETEKSKLYPVTLDGVERFFRSPDGDETHTFEKLAKSRGANYANAYLYCRCLADATGRRILEDSDIATVSKWPTPRLVRLQKPLADAMGVSEDAVAEITGNSESPTSNSGTGSRSLSGEPSAS